jgi:hypothetical protein
MPVELIKLISIELRMSKSGKSYKGFITSIGPMSCFILPLVSKLEALIGSEVKLSYEIVNGFKNIKSIVPSDT